MATVLTLPEGPLALELLKVRSRARVDRLCDDCAYAATLLIAGARTRWWWTHRHRPSCAHPRHRPRLLPSTPTPTPMSTTSVPILAWPPTVHQPQRATRWSVHRTARSGHVVVCRRKRNSSHTDHEPSWICGRRKRVQDRWIQEMRYVDALFPAAAAAAAAATSSGPSPTVNATSGDAQPKRVYASEAVVTTILTEKDLDDVRCVTQPLAVSETAAARA